MSTIAVTSGEIWRCERSCVVACDRRGRRVRSIELAGATAVAAADDRIYVAARGRIWRNPGGGDASPSARTGSAVRGLCLDPDRDRLYAATAAGIVAIDEGAPRVIAPVSNAAGLALAPDRRRLYAAGGNSVIAIDLFGEQPPRQVVSHLAACTDVCITPAGLAAVDRRAGLLGVNLRHQSARPIWTELEAPSAVAFDWINRAYLVADGADRLVRIAADGSAATLV